MKLRLLALTTACALGLSGCAIIAPPKPNKPLQAVAESALNDSAGLAETDASLSALRSEQAQALFAEIARLCGRNKEGATPPECVLPTADATPSTGDATSLATAAQEQILAQLDDFPKESLPRVFEVYTQLAPYTAERNPGDVPTKDTKSVDAMRAWENSVIFGLDVALAFAGNATTDIEAAVEVHKEIANALPAGETPAPTSYDLSGYPHVSDTDSAREFMQAVQADSVKRWSISAAETKDPSWRKYALIQAGNVARLG
ncbi:hypothetical protein WG936_01530 [Corynebacterium sp. H127]|uniref:hypothetical protein n=1 Tax=Corynebacterium sp. H127 TaxID=3133418 RepID=UPI00309EC6C0